MCLRCKKLWHNENTTVFMFFYVLGPFCISVHIRLEAGWAKEKLLFNIFSKQTATFVRNIFINSFCTKYCNSKPSEATPAVMLGYKNNFEFWKKKCIYYFGIAHLSATIWDEIPFDPSAMVQVSSWLQCSKPCSPNISTSDFILFLNKGQVR